MAVSDGRNTAQNAAGVANLDGSDRMGPNPPAPRYAHASSASPTMIRNGYGRGFSAAAIAVGSLITATIPPSIGLILYGYIGNVSIGRLFLAGIIPGLLMMVGMMATVYVISKRRGYVVADAQRPSLGELAAAIWGAKWALLFPVALVLAIRVWGS